MLTCCSVNGYPRPPASIPDKYIVCDLQVEPIFSVSVFSEKVKDQFPEGSFSSSTKLVLINTVYFKGLWDRGFKKEHTKEEDFWLNKVLSFIYVVCLHLACTV